MATYINLEAHEHRIPIFENRQVRQFHQQLPGYATTPLIPLPTLATELKLAQLFVKDESDRCGLPSFKNLGASYGTYRALIKKLNLSEECSLDQVKRSSVTSSITLFAATDGNHGRAVARMAKLLSIRAYIYVPKYLDARTRAFISSESAEISVIEVDGDYDEAVKIAFEESKKSENHVLIQDMAFEGYIEIAEWIVDGYSTLLHEVHQQLLAQRLDITHIVTPVGVGSLAQAVVTWAKNPSIACRVIAVEPETAACLNASLHNGESTTITTGNTIMDGMNCGSVSTAAWPILRQGVDCSTIIDDLAAHQTVGYLADNGVNAGPCGAGVLAGLKKIAGVAKVREALEIDEKSVIVVLSTEGSRAYDIGTNRSKPSHDSSITPLQ